MVSCCCSVHDIPKQQDKRRRKDGKRRQCDDVEWSKAERFVVALVRDMETDTFHLRTSSVCVCILFVYIWTHVASSNLVTVGNHENSKKKNKIRWKPWIRKI